MPKLCPPFSIWTKHVRTGVKFCFNGSTTFLKSTYGTHSPVVFSVYFDGKL